MLDFAGYGESYPGLFTIELDVYCSDENGNPSGHLWNSGPRETRFGWNYFSVSPYVRLDQHCDNFYQNPTIIVTMTFTGTEGKYPVVGFDNIGTAVEAECAMHDYGCLPAFRPRGYLGGEDPKVHSGYAGTYAFEYWPPIALPDGMHAGGGAPVAHGYVEVAWRVYMYCGMKSPKAVDPTSWGGIKSLYE